MIFILQLFLFEYNILIREILLQKIKEIYFAAINYKYTYNSKILNVTWTKLLNCKLINHCSYEFI